MEFVHESCDEIENSESGILWRVAIVLTLYHPNNKNRAMNVRTISADIHDLPGFISLIPSPTPSQGSRSSVRQFDGMFIHNSVRLLTQWETRVRPDRISIFVWKYTRVYLKSRITKISSHA